MPVKPRMLETNLPKSYTSYTSTAVARGRNHLTRYHFAFLLDAFMELGRSKIFFRSSKLSGSIRKLQVTFVDRRQCE